MRVIAGRLGGRLFDSPHSHRTHPMSDKARGALFNILGDIGGLTVLDPFGGTGALSFEAVSRGAANALVIESDRPAQRVIEQNIKALGLRSEVKLITAQTGAWLQTNHDDQFDLVLCDPPHDDLQPNLLMRLSQRVVPGGLLVISWPGSQETPSFPKFDRIEQRSYGDMQLAFYRKTE
jgi:16S rRNA (guanine966-N2)-methyltransferase